MSPPEPRPMPQRNRQEQWRGEVYTHSSTKRMTSGTLYWFTYNDETFHGILFRNRPAGSIWHNGRRYRPLETFC